MRLLSVLVLFLVSFFVSAVRPASKMKRIAASAVLLSSTFVIMPSSMLQLRPAATMAEMMVDEYGTAVNIPEERGVSEVWGERLKKASQMEGKDIILAARGAKNTEKREGPESKASKKRRAFAGCRTREYRQMIPGGVSEIDCTVRVNKGDVDFMLNLLDQN